MWTAIKAWVNKLRAIEWLRAAYRTAFQTFLGIFGISLLGWFAAVQQWAGDTDGQHFPSVSPLGKAAAAALAAAGAGVVAAVMKALGKDGPSYTPPPAPPAD